MKQKIIIVCAIIGLAAGIMYVSMAFQKNGSIFLKDSCSIKCGDGSCSAGCKNDFTASCNCSSYMTADGKKVDMPVCSCGTIFMPDRDPSLGSVSGMDDTFVTATKDQLNNIAKFRESVLKTVKPKGLAKRIAKNLETIEFALEHNQTTTYRIALEKFIEDFETVQPDAAGE